MPVHHIHKQEILEGHNILVFCLSSKPSDVDVYLKNHQLTVKQHSTSREITLSGKLKDDANHSELTSIRFPWQQILRGIAAHGDTVKTVHLLASKSKNPNDTLDSFKDLAACKMLLEHYGLKVECFDKGLDFEDVHALGQALESLIKQRKKSHRQSNDIMIDCTGGTKTTSIAAAMVTLHHPDISFQYVTHQGKVFAYNIVNRVTDLS